MPKIQTKLLINGQFVKGEGAAISVLNSATGADICLVNEASMAQIENGRFVACPR